MLPVRPSAVRLLPLLLGVGCLDTNPTGTPEAPSTTDSGGLDSGQAPATMSGFGGRITASARAFHPTADGFAAQAMGFSTTLHRQGATLTRGHTADAGTLQLTVTGWGREHETLPLDAIDVEAGLCTAAMGVDGTCIQRVERLHPGLDEWWVALGGAVEFGFDLHERPDGTAPIVVTLDVDGADIETDGETAWLTDDTRGLWTLDGLVAWDADGVVLGSLLDVDDQGQLMLVVDDTDARWPITIDPVISTAAATLSDGSGTDGHGYTVEGAGDIDGDGFDDVVVGAPFGSNAVYVYYGSASGLASTPDQTISSPLSGTSDDDWGWDVSGAGDVNGDGFDDVVVGARKWNSNVGKAVVLLGSGSGLATTGTELDGSGAGQLGSAVSGAGDVNGDGYDDVVVGEPSANSGTVYVYHGAASGMDSTIQTTIVAGASAGNLGAAVGPAGDVNADGYDDIIIGDDGGSGFAGEFHIHHGTPAGADTVAATTVTAAFAYSRLGAAVDTADDVNGDGYDDVVVGAFGNATVTPRVSVYEGGAAGVGAGADATITGPTGSSFGRATAGLGDVNGDGYGDILIGAQGAGTSFQGLVELYLGSPDGMQTSPESDATGTTTGLALGSALGGAGDVNGDGFDDFLVATGYGFYQVFVYHGAPTDQDGDGYLSDVDCDDTNGTISPGAVESPGDEVDSDCDGTELCYADADLDGFTDGTVASADIDCTGVGEATAESADDDCDDTDASIYPGATELVGDGVDSDCTTTEICYADNDQDGFTDGTLVSSDTDCGDPGESSFPSSATDCDDGDDAIYPGSTEFPGDEVDSDCDGQEICFSDDDNDTYTDGSVISADTDCADAGETTIQSAVDDCNDNDTYVNPAATEITGDEVDGDCDGIEICYADADLDGYTYGIVGSTDEDCSDAGESTTESAVLDCDDTVATTYPGAPEVTGDEVDSDCDDSEICYADADLDGFTGGTVVSADIDCSGTGESTTATSVLDCNDADDAIYPGATELVGDAVDSDCDGAEVCYADADNDGYTDGTVASTDVDCTGTGEAAAASSQADCDDADSAVNPAASEVVGNGIDDDCDGTAACWADADNDGYTDGATTTLSFDTDCNDPGEAPDGAPTGECDDTDPRVFPGATEYTGDGIDSNCDGAETCYADADGDGFADASAITVTSVDADCTDFGEADLGAPRTDCDDQNAAVRPGADEHCDGLDNDCDGAIDPVSSVDALTWYVDADEDGFGDASATMAACTVPAGYTADATDCDDSSAAVYPMADELCDGVDNDCDGTIDPDTALDAPLWFADSDGDLYGDPSSGVASCEAVPGHVEDATDCDDDNGLVWPGAEEWPNDGVDQDCDGKDNIDDGFASGGCATAETGPSGWGALAVLAGLLGFRRRRSEGTERA